MTWAERTSQHHYGATEACLPGEAARRFPVLFISAPHLEDAVNGSFPGLPTPLLYATALMSALLRKGRFPAAMKPEVTAVMNPSRYTDNFEAQLRAHIRRYRPRLVGISNMSESHFYALRIARVIKEEHPVSIVLLGGQHEDATNPAAYMHASERVLRMPASRSSQYMFFTLSEAEISQLRSIQTLSRPEERQSVDFVFAGDAPYFLVEFLRILADHIDLDNDKFKEVIIANKGSFASLQGTGNLSFVDPVLGLTSLQLSGQPLIGDELPYIDMTGLTDQNRFPVFSGKLTAQVMASIGCKYACAFCHESADHFLYNVPKIIQRSPENVIGELELRLEQGFRAVFFDDSTFTQNRHWLDKFLGLLDDASCLDKALEWGCQTTINDVNRSILGRMADSGCSYIYFGFESARPDGASVQKAARLVNSPDSLAWEQRFCNVATWCKEAGIRVGTSLQFGLGESMNDRLRTFELVAGLHRAGVIPDGCVALNINTPYPGTKEWLDLLHNGSQIPDYGKRLERHHAFETAHQYSLLSYSEADQLYEVASRILGTALHGGETAAASPFNPDD